MTRKLLILSAIFLFAGFVLGAVEAKKVCPVCDEEIKKTDYCVLRNGAEVHFGHGIVDHFKSLKKSE